MGKLPKRDVGGTVTIGGVDLCWRFEREPQWCTADGYKGITISVKSAEGSYRELLLEYPYGWGELPKRPKISPKVIEADIQKAIASGWDPISRGKTFAYQVTEKSN